MKEEFRDEDLGVIYVQRNSRAKRLIARRKEDATYLTVPQFYSLKQIKSLLEELKPRLLKLKPAVKFFFDESTQLQTLTFSLNIKRENVRNYYTSLNNNILNIVCPSDTDFSDTLVQTKLRRNVENVLRNEAKRIVPAKVEMYAKKHGFIFSDVKVNKSRSRWGSCSSKKSINISWFCMLLPEYLLDFVILHELCHTVEMNHGKHFWTLLDKITSGYSVSLTKDLKIFRITW